MSPPAPVRPLAASPERPPGEWNPQFVPTSGQRPTRPRTQPPPSRSQADDALQKAADMFRASAPAASSSQPPAPASTSVADFQQTTAPVTPPKNPGAKGPSKLVSTTPLTSMNRCFKQHIAALTNSCWNKSHGGPKAETLWITMKKA